ncbi:MAG: 4a-hydroxytetrahydrobiopterin dehydratase [Elusimicrobia bacterium]|nr:4a-hydroxytetrahydrobiopterin dehydratase [Elusimicrobiota bacterium]
MNPLLSKKCAPCEGGVKRMPLKRARRLAAKLPGWSVVAGKALRRRLVMRDFAAAIAFIRAAARTAEAEGHHPDLHLTGYRNLTIELSTHAIGGLSINDFILAAKLDALPRRLPSRRAG